MRKALCIDVFSGMFLCVYGAGERDRQTHTHRDTFGYPYALPRINVTFDGAEKFGYFTDEDKKRPVSVGLERVHTR